MPLAWLPHLNAGLNAASVFLLSAGLLYVSVTGVVVYAMLYHVYPSR